MRSSAHLYQNIRCRPTVSAAQTKLLTGQRSRFEDVINIKRPSLNISMRRPFITREFPCPQQARRTTVHFECAKFMLLENASLTSSTGAFSYFRQLMLFEEYRGDYIYRYHPRASQQLFYKKLGQVRPFKPAMLLQAALSRQQLQQFDQLRSFTNNSILGVFGASLLPILLFRRLPYLKHRSRRFRVIFSVIALLVPTNLLSVFLNEKTVELEERVFRNHREEFGRYLNSGDAFSFGEVK